MKGQKKRLKVLFIPLWYPEEEKPIFGIFTREHAIAISRYDDVIIVYAAESKNAPIPYEKVSDKIEDGVRVIRLRYRRLPIRKLSKFFYVSGIHSVFRDLLKEGWVPDIIHANVYEAGLPALFLKKKYGIPFVVTEHWTGFPLRRLSLLSRLEAKLVFEGADRVLPVSEDLAEAIKAYGIKARFNVVPNVVDISLFTYDKNTVPAEKKKIIFVGGLIPRKGVELLIKAVHEIYSVRKDFELHMVGDGPLRDKLHSLVNALGLNEVVTFHGILPKREIANLMRNSSFIILPSLQENLPCVLIEGMASGLPVVATDVGGVKEMVSPSEGILIPPGDVKAIKDAILWMMDNLARFNREEISRKAHNRYSYEAVGQSFHSIYEKILSGK